MQSVISVPRRYIFTVDYFLHILTLPSEHLTLNLRPVFSVLPPPRTFLARPTRVTCQCSGSDRCFVIRDFTAVIQSHQQCKPSLRCQDPAENKNILFFTMPMSNYDNSCENSVIMARVSPGHLTSFTLGEYLIYQQLLK